MAKLIDLYQEEENLYNYRCKEYHDRIGPANRSRRYPGQWEKIGMVTHYKFLSPHLGNNSDIMYFL